MTRPRQTPRSAAVYLLDQIIGEQRLMSELLGGGALDRLEPGDRARAQRLANETLRGLERADRLLQHHLRKNPPMTVHNVLRLATVELCQGGDAHGIVNEAVSIVGASRRTGQLKGMVNAVLRKIAAKGPEEWARLRVPRLPKWLRKPLVQAYDSETIAAIEAAHFAGAPVDLTWRKGGKQELPGTETHLLPTGSMRLTGGVQVSALPGYEQGQWWVQDAAAALPAQVLAVQPGEKVLDMCAAPGGKTMQLADAGGDVTAVDVSESRLARVRENLERTGLSAKVVAQDVLEHADGPYDAILLDAPCSATGTIRRHPDLPLAKDGSEFGGLIELQSVMLDHAINLLKPGGRLVFCTCSLLPDEGECQIDDVLGRRDDVSVLPEAVKVAGVQPEWCTSEGGLRLRPDYLSDLGGMDGFYMVCLQRNA